MSPSRSGVHRESERCVASVEAAATARPIFARPTLARRAGGLVLVATVLAAAVTSPAAGGARSRETAVGGTTLVRHAATRHAPDSGSCFLLYEVRRGLREREPSRACSWRISPASTFKVPHAIAALDAGVVRGPDEVIAYDAAPNLPPAWQQDHTLASAMRYSVVWYFQALARRLGMAREQAYLTRLDFGNADPTSGLTTFWLGGSLTISPDEQLQFWQRLYADSLPVASVVQQQVRAMLVQPEGEVTNASGHHPFAAPWPPGTILSAKTGSTSDGSGRGIRWLIGHVQRGPRAYLFVSCVVGSTDLAGDAALRLAEARLRAARVL